MKILGISAYYHDSAVAIIENGKVVAAMQEERFTRIKNDDRFPKNAIQKCLDVADCSFEELDAIVFYEKPFLKFERLIDNYLSTSPKSLISFITAMPNWLKDKVFFKKKLRNDFQELFPDLEVKKKPIYFSEHHLSHAASAFYVSPFEQALIVVMDGVGEYATTSIWQGNGRQIQKLYEQHFPDSIGLLYSAFTQFLGFEVNNGEYKVMGLAPYADEKDKNVQRLLKLIKENIVTIYEDGSIKLNQYYFKYTQSLRMIHKERFETLFEIPQRQTQDELTEEHTFVAQALQLITEEIVFKILHFANNKFPNSNLCLAGGVALNCVLNGKIKESNLFDDIFIQPASGDAGGSLGAALALYHQHFGKDRKLTYPHFNPYLGTEYHNQEIERFLIKNKISYEYYPDEELVRKLANSLSEGKIVGHFRGKMEFGPRALGHRSILADPRKDDVQSQLNMKIKKRESFRPFAPIMLKEEFETYFEQKYDSPYMLMVHKLKGEYQLKNEKTSDLLGQVKQKRSPFPGVTHVDYSSRIQTVEKKDNLFIHNLLTHFKDQTGLGMLVNTSFNVKDEPIVESPKDAWECFNSTEIDILVLNNYWIEKWNF